METIANFERDPRELISFSPPPTHGVIAELMGAIQRLSLARTLREIQEIVRSCARQLTGADGATFVLLDGSHCYYADEDAISPLWKGQRFPTSQCVSGWVMHHKQPVAIEDIYSDPRVPHDAYRPTFVRSLAMVPIRQLEPLGAIGNYWAQPHKPTREELQLLQALADSTAVAVENVRIYEELEEARLETLRRLALAAEYRDDGTHEHPERVARTAALIAERLGAGDTHTSLLRQAAPLHDIGKIAIPDAILLKPSKLTPEEFDEIKRHPEVGAAILAGSRSHVLRMAEEIALTHHEWWDGSGYPHGIGGDDIPLSGRIVTIADVYDALTHERPYKQAWAPGEATREIERLADRQFDPRLVNALVELRELKLV